MALDEALLEHLPRLARPVLRFYAWTQPAATFGYFQRYADVERATKLRPLVRRPTGGGIVPHEADWTYSLAVPAGLPWHALIARESYRRIHAWIQAAFAQLGVSTQLAPGRHQTAPGQCFAGHEQSDLLWQGGKIAGAAQRRARTGLLIQGSVQTLDISAARERWQQAMRAVAQSAWAVRWHTLELDDTVRERADRLARQKYESEAYNRKR